MDLWLTVILGVALGVWACYKQVRDDKRKRQRQAQAKARSSARPSSSRYTIKTDSDGYSRVIDKTTGDCVFESPDRAAAADWKKAHE